MVFCIISKPVFFLFFNTGIRGGVHYTDSSECRNVTKTDVGLAEMKMPESGMVENHGSIASKLED